MKQKQTLKTDLWIPRGRGFGGRDWDFSKLLHIEWINNKVLLHGTGHYIQYPVINHNGKEHKKEYIYIWKVWKVSFSFQLCSTVVSNSFPPHGLELPSSSVHGSLQARILEWIAIPFSRGCSWPRVQTWVSWMTGRALPSESPGKPQKKLIQHCKSTILH